MSNMKLIMENFRKRMSNESQGNTFTYNVIEDEFDGGPTVEIDGIETTFEEMIQSLEGKTLDFDDGEGPFQFSIAPFGGEAWNLIRDGLAADFVEKWAEMNGLSAKRTGAYYEGLRSLVEPYKQVDANSFEGELFDYLEKNPRGVNVAMMRYAFGGSSQKWTRMLQGLVTQGKLEQSGEMYRLPETPAEV